MTAGCSQCKLVLQAKVRQQGWLTEAQLRAAAAVASRRADDEALHTRQQLAKLRRQFQHHQVQHVDRAPAVALH